MNWLEKSKLLAFGNKNKLLLHFLNRNFAAYELISLSLQRMNSLLENKVRLFLDRNDIHYIYQYFPKFLNDGSGHQSLDFYLPEYNIAIECQGMQHYKPVKLFGGEEQFIKQIALDKNKRELCEKNGIKILYYSTYQYRDSKTLSSLKRLLYEIKN